MPSLRSRSASAPWATPTFERTREGQGDVSHFGALATALASTVGTGKHRGRGHGCRRGRSGRGAVNVLTGVFSIATKYAEALLSVKYRITTPSGSMARTRWWCCGLGCASRMARLRIPSFRTSAGHSSAAMQSRTLLAKHVRTASRRCLSLKHKRVSPHVLRHTAAMDLLQHGVDRSVIALWLGHESAETTQVYLHADLQLKEAALAKTAPFERPRGRYRPGDRLLAFLKSL